jgi:hypothetical protein
MEINSNQTYTEFVASSEVIKEPYELRLGGRVGVIYGEKTDRVDMVLGRNPNSLNRTRFDSNIGAGRKIFLRDEKGGRLGDMSRRAVEARYSSGVWTFMNLITGETKKVDTGKEDGLNNLTVDLGDAFQLRVAGVSKNTGDTAPRIRSFIFERKN